MTLAHPKANASDNHHTNDFYTSHEGKTEILHLPTALMMSYDSTAPPPR
jgi:hypothetical protein